MDDADLDLDTRLSALAGRAPGRDDPPALVSVGRRRRLVLSLTLGPVLVLALVATATAGLVAVNQLAKAYPGIENPGQPLAGARLECLTPPQAAAFLAGHGYRDVVWQVESGDVHGPKGASRSIQQATPPEHGYVIPTSVLDDGRLYVVIDQRTGATGMGACAGMPMP